MTLTARLNQNQTSLKKGDCWISLPTVTQYSSFPESSGTSMQIWEVKMPKQNLECHCTHTSSQMVSMNVQRVGCEKGLLSAPLPFKSLKSHNPILRRLTNQVTNHLQVLGWSSKYVKHMMNTPINFPPVTAIRSTQLTSCVVSFREDLGGLRQIRIGGENWINGCFRF